MKQIFLSYRRDDSPGYVSRLEEELERAFGEGRVFRDATDIPGGTKWKSVIDENLQGSAALILVIGPRWEQIWLERINDDVNYIVLELQRAHELGVPIIPVTLDGTQLSKGLDLGSINFIRENQFHDISDRQGRWRNDFNRLVSLLESVPGLGPAHTSNTTFQSATSQSATSRQHADTDRKSGFKWLAAVVGLLIVAGVWLGTSVGIDEPGIDPNPHEPSDQSTVVQDNARTPPEGDANPGKLQDPEIVQRTLPDEALPIISGTWQGEDGTVYLVQQYDDGTFSVDSPGYGSGEGRFFTDMPRKFEIEMFGIGRGEFSVSASGDRAMGWITIDGQQEYDTLIRVE